MSPTRWRRARRLLLRDGLVAAAGLPLAATPLGALAQGAPAAIVGARRVQAPWGAQVGDLAGDRAILWSAADRPARMLVEWSTTESFQDARRVEGPLVLEDTGYAAKLDLAGLPPGQRISYRVRFLDLADYATLSEPVTGSFQMPPAERRDIRIVWSGDVVGQGWGIDPDRGGMRIFETIRRRQPDLFIHSGDVIYADGPLVAERPLPDGGTWRNLVTEAKVKVAETLGEFRGNYTYNLMDENLRRLNAEVPVLAQWDDHEVIDNWYWQRRKDGDDRYREKSVAILAARGMRAFHEMMPVRRHPLEQDRLFASFPYGPSLEVFRIDLRSYRGPNGDGLETALSPESRIIGQAQLAWLMAALKASRARWKLVACDMPLGLVVWDDWRARRGAEAVAQGEMGPPLGRELEIADLLRFIRDEAIRNVVWVTADVHYTAAHRYDPARAAFQDFLPFWEFVSGPLHAGTFGPNALDRTFGPEAIFQTAPPADTANLPPSAGLQFFGEIRIDGQIERMTVSLCDVTGAVLFSQELLPEP
jgi:alkaline phosphatase D